MIKHDATSDRLCSSRISYIGKFIIFALDVGEGASMEMATAGMSEDTNNSVGTSEAEMLVRAHYETLKHMARAKRRRAGAGLTMQTTDLLHECWLKLRRQQEWRDEAHFMNTAALAMRQVLVDYARSKLAGKRHAVGGVSSDDIDEIEAVLPEFRENPEEIVAISDLLNQLEKQNPRLARVTILRYFAGYTEEETARALDVTSRTIRRDWQIAKAWLAAELGPSGSAKTI